MGNAFFWNDIHLMGVGVTFYEAYLVSNKSILYTDGCEFPSLLAIQCLYVLLSIKITKPITFVIFSLFLSLIILRFPDFDKLATTSCLVICPPKVIGPWCSVLGTLDHSKKWSSEVTWPVTSPPMLLIQFHLSMERVIHLSNDNIIMQISLMLILLGCN